MIRIAAVPLNAESAGLSHQPVLALTAPITKLGRQITPSRQDAIRP